MYKEFKQILEDAKEKNIEKIAIELQQVPDPDAMASALFVYDLAKALGYTPSITHACKLSHPQNVVMAKRLGTPLTCYENNTNINPDDFDAFIFVDHSGKTSPWYREGKINDEKVIAIIDHHDNDIPTPEGIFADKRVVGATSSILAEYLQQGAQEEFYQNEKDLQKIATALLLGIRTDTKQLKRNVTPFDKDNHHYLLQYADMNLVDAVENIEWSKQWMDFYGRAIHKRKTQNGITIASVGFIPAKERDVIPMIAEQLLTERGVHTAYVWGLRPDIIDISLRTDDETYDYSKIREIFPEGNGGGKEGAGGVQIPSPFTSESFISTKDEHGKERIEHMLDEEIEKRIFK